MWSPQKGPTRLWDLRFSLLLILQLMFSLVLAGNELWPMERPDGMPNIVSLEVMCGKDHMDVHLTFSHPFEGIVSSKGQHSDPRCVYVPPSTGKTFFSFRISYSRCGTKPDLNGQFYENTVVVQYDKDLLEVWDEAKRLRCEWFNDYEKTASKPPMVIADLDVIQLDFRGDNVDCWMEIQHGRGPWAPPVSGIVPLGSTLTLVVAINDYRGEFDMRVKSCVASDGSGHVINLSDEFGCVLRPKMISRFLKSRAPDERATVITYAFFHAFKFPDALSVHIKCKVEICRHGCLDHCQSADNSNERKDVIGHDQMMNKNDLLHEMANNHHGMSSNMHHNIGGGGHTNEVGVGSVSGGGNMGHGGHGAGEIDHDVFYDDIIHNRKQLSQINSGIANILDHFQNVHEKSANLPPRPVHEDPEEQDLDDIFGEEDLANLDEAQYMELRNSGKFPHGPRQLAQKRMGIPMAGPRSLEPKDDTPRPVYRPQAEALTQNREDHIDLDAATKEPEGDDGSLKKSGGDNKTTAEGTPRRRRRSIVISDRKVRSADVGVSGLYDVISEADLAFSPDTKQEAVTVFQGKITEEVVYGICMPVPGFSILFIVVISATIVSALIAGSLLYRYQLQKEAMAKEAPMPVYGTLASWMTLRMFRMRQQAQQQHEQNAAQNAAAVAAVHNSLSAAAAAAATLSHESMQ
ncbi:zona pellucida domain-containing protein miniature [Haematobia irritans]|uniref:zona pellucida domain-containing protein miniature n=1 Tax=Haematobia irritans TaxID=7368 RepID=UPI003F5048DF